MAPHNFITGGNKYNNVDRVVQFATVSAPHDRLENFGQNYVGGRDVADGERTVSESVQMITKNYNL